MHIHAYTYLHHISVIILKVLPFLLMWLLTIRIWSIFRLRNCCLAGRLIGPNTFVHSIWSLGFGLGISEPNPMHLLIVPTSTLKEGENIMVMLIHTIVDLFSHPNNYRLHSKLLPYFLQSFMDLFLWTWKSSIKIFSLLYKLILLHNPILQILIIPSMLNGQKILQDSSELINGSMYQIPSVFGSEFYSIIVTVLNVTVLFFFVSLPLHFIVSPNYYLQFHQTITYTVTHVFHCFMCSFHFLADYSRYSIFTSSSSSCSTMMTPCLSYRDSFASINTQ